MNEEALLIMSRKIRQMILPKMVKRMAKGIRGDIFIKKRRGNACTDGERYADAFKILALGI